jgi:hypothetical protein
VLVVLSGLRHSVVLALAAFVVCVSDAHALAPAHGTILPLGVRPTFALVDRWDGFATVEVSKSPQTDVDGVFARHLWSTGYDSRPGDRRIRVTPGRSSSPNRFWNKPGRYYWHAYRVVCPYTGPRPHTCSARVITRTRSFTVANHK